MNYFFSLYTCYSVKCRDFIFYNLLLSDFRNKIHYGKLFGPGRVKILLESMAQSY